MAYALPRHTRSRRSRNRHGARRVRRQLLLRLRGEEHLAKVLEQDLAAAVLRRECAIRVHTKLSKCENVCNACV